MSESEDIKPGLEIGWEKLRDIGIGDRPVVIGGPGINVAGDPKRITVSSISPDGLGDYTIDALIVGNQPIGPNKWSYTWAETLLKTYPADPAEWIEKDPGNSSTTLGVALNRYEIPNSDTGIQGNGVDVGNLVGTFALRPVATGIVVKIEFVTFSDGSGIQPWFSEPNGVDGQCPAAPSQNLTNQYLLSQHPPP